jgi:hypothetical protein
MIAVDSDLSWVSRLSVASYYCRSSDVSCVVLLTTVVKCNGRLLSLTA